MPCAPQAAALALACLISAAPMTESFSFSSISSRTLHASALSATWACRRTPKAAGRYSLELNRSI